MKLQSWKTTLSILGFSLPVCLPLFTTLQLSGHDDLEYFPRLIEFHENIRYGILLPRWAPDLSAGYGQPLFLFNPPLLYYIGELWHLIGLDFITALNATSIAIIFGSASTMYFLGKLYFGHAGGMLAAIAYVYAPYFHTDLYIRHALAEFLAFAFYPLALLGLAGYVRSRNKLFLLAAAAGFAAILFSHNPSALLFTPLLVAFVFFNAWRTKSWVVLAWQSGALLFGLGLAACIWVPILAEKEAVSVHRLLQGHLHYSNHFIHFQQLFSTAWGYSLSRSGMSYSLGWSHLILIAIAWVLARRWPERVAQSWMAFFTLAVVILCALMLPMGQSIWDRITFLQYVQFPWRILAPVTVCLALLIAPLGSLINETIASRWLWIGGAMAILVLLNFSHAQPRSFYPLDIDALTPDQLARKGIAVTTREEYEPIWVTDRAPYRANKIEVISGDARIISVNTSPTRLRADMAVSEVSVLELGISYFPGWKVWIDGEDVKTEITSGTGLIRFAAPPGKHRIEARFTRTAPRWIGEGLSVFFLSMILCLSWCWWQPKNSLKEAVPFTKNGIDTPKSSNQFVNIRGLLGHLWLVRRASPRNTR